MAKHCEYMQQIKHLKVGLSEIEDIIERHKTIKEWAYIIHDKDVDKYGNPKEPHIHLYLNFGKSGASFETVAKWFKDEPQYVCKVKGRKGDVLMYLTHQNATDKYPYDIKEVISNFDINQAITNDQARQTLIDSIDEVLFSFVQEKITYAKAQKRLQEIKQCCKDHEVLDNWISAFDKVQKLWKQQCLMSTKGKRDMQIIFIHGDGGSGKSTYAEMYAKMLCDKKGYRDFSRSSASNDMLQDYMGEDILILDDYRDVDDMTGKTENLSDVLKMLDPHYVSSSKSRYVNKTFTGKLMIITSAKDPLTWFEGTKEQRWQFFRRISMLIEIDKDKVIEYQEKNEERGIPFLCGFRHDGAYIEKAKEKSRFTNPVPEYIKIVGKTEEETNDMYEDITAYLSELKKEKAEAEASANASQSTGV